MLELRAPELLAIKAPLHFLSYEPALGTIAMHKGDAPPQLVKSEGKDHPVCKGPGIGPQHGHAIHWDFRWVLAGGESGPKARPANPGWFRSLRAQCVAAGVPYFFKQWGEWSPAIDGAATGRRHLFGDGAVVQRVGKKAAGAMLDGREWRESPPFRGLGAAVSNFSRVHRGVMRDPVGSRC
jgi:Protein of unknown function (DUF5131)